jgi:DNA primase
VVDYVGRIPEDFIQSLLSRIDIVEVIGAVVPLRKAGTNYVACCPFHNEKTPSFSVNQQKQFYHCFGCGVSGDAIQFIKERNSLSFVEAIELLAGQCGMQMPINNQSAQSAEHNMIYTVLSEATAFYEQQLRQHNLTNPAVKYLKDRGLTGITAKNFRLGFAPPGWDNLLNSIAKDNTQRDVGVKAGIFINKEGNKFYDRFRNRVMFPIRDRRGKVIGFGARIIGKANDEPKYLNSPETPVFNKSRELYGFFEAKQAIQKQQFVLVVEGYMDVVAVSQAGINNVVATLGTACTEQHIQYLFKVVPEVVFCFDGDTAGKKAAWRALELCLPVLDDQHRVKFLLLPSGEDPDSFVRKNGAAALELLIKKAISLPDYLFDAYAKRYDLAQIDDRVQFANKMKEYVSKLPEGMLKTMLFDRLARIIDVDPRMFRNKNSNPQHRLNEFNQTILSKSKPKTDKVKSLALVSPAIRALALLIYERSLVAELPNLVGLEKCDITGSDLLCSVSTILDRSPEAIDREISDQLPPDLAKAFIPDELRAIARIVPHEGLKQEFLGAIDLLRKREKELILDELLFKAKENLLSVEEKIQLQQMLQDK